MATTDKSKATPAQDEAESAGWRPSEGDMVSGPIVAVSKGWSDWTNSFYPLVTIHDETQDKDVDVHCFHQTLQARLMETRPKVGDLLEITYIGKQKTKDGKREVAIYRVNVPGATGQEVWDALDAQPQAAARAAVTGDVPPDTDGMDIPF